MAEINGGRAVARQLKLAGVDTAFGVVAGPMIEVMAGMQQEGIRVVNCRHEENGGFMASAWGYLAKKPGVLVVGSGPGMTNAVTPLHVATESGMPLVVLGGSAAGRERGWGAFQEADQVAFAAPGSKWTRTVDATQRIPEYVHLALGKALSGRPGGVYLDFPGNLISRRVDVETLTFRRTPPLVTAPHPDPAGIEAAARLLAEAERPLILIGKGAAWADAGPALERLVALGFPFVASPMGRGVVSDDSPYCVNPARSTALANADALLMIGGRFNWMFQFGRPPRYAAGVRIAHVDIVAEEMYSAADVEVGIVADARVAAEQLAEALRGRSLRTAQGDWAAKLQEESRRNANSLAEQLDSDERPINHYRLLRDVKEVVPRNATVTSEGELTMGVARIVLSGYGPGRQLSAGTTGCMGTGVPYALGAKLAFPDAPSVAVLGDYAFGAAAMEVETAARLGLAVVFVIANNGGIVGHTLQDRMFAPDAPPIAALIPAEYEKLAEMVGGYARRIDDPAEIKPALREALAANTVAVLNVMTDPSGGRRGSSYLG